MTGSCKTCATCRHYEAFPPRYVNTPPEGQCEGPPSDYIVIKVADDHGLSEYFRPPPTFGCKSWQPRKEIIKP